MTELPPEAIQRILDEHQELRRNAVKDNKYSYWVTCLDCPPRAGWSVHSPVDFVAVVDKHLAETGPAFHRMRISGFIRSQWAGCTCAIPITVFDKTQRDPNCPRHGDKPA